MKQRTLDTWSGEKRQAVMQVSEVTEVISKLLDTPILTNIKVSGEITNFKRHGSGHLYFSLSERKGDKEFTIRCSIWKSAARYLPWTPEDGLTVEAFGSISHYERNGQYSFIISQMWQSGAGEKAAQIEQWKKTLTAKGYFAPERKRLLPEYPQKIGVVTSDTGAVIHDIQNVISIRFPVEIVLSPTSVQGQGAEDEIAAAIRRVSGIVDVIIVGRGGGSYEDLFVFNHPVVVEAIATCKVPVIAAIGHEVDITLADLAADFRASTPSHAAEMCVKDRKTELELLSHFKTRLFKRLLSRIEQADEELNDIRERLASSRLERKLSERRQYLVDLSDRMDDITQLVISTHRIILREHSAQMERKNPVSILKREIPERKYRLSDLGERLRVASETRLSGFRTDVTTLASILEAHNPYRASKEGYCLILRSGEVIKSTSLLTPGDQVEIKFSDGTAHAEINEVNQHEKI